MSNPQFMNLVFSMEFKFTSGIYFFIQAIFLSYFFKFLPKIYTTNYFQRHLQTYR